MSKLYACIISPDVKRDKGALLSIADRLSASIEVLEDGVLFDVSGLERLVGGADRISQKIFRHLERHSVSGGVAVASTADAAILLARYDRGRKTSQNFRDLPLEDLEIDEDVLDVFNSLGINKIHDLREIPKDELIRRYGREFSEVIDVVEEKGRRSLTPNVKETSAAGSYQLDQPVEDFAQLIFVLNHGLDKLFARVFHNGYSTEQLDIFFTLDDKTERSYEIKASFPTLDKAFWLKLINLRIALDPPEAEIVSINVVSWFTRPRSTQRGLYAVSRPEPESLLLTVNKIKRLVGEGNVGVPALLDQRLAQPFRLDPDQLPKGKESVEMRAADSIIIAFSYFYPPVPAEVFVQGQRLIYLRTQHFSGRVEEYSGVWRENSCWWGTFWETEGWDVEVENNGIYRLCREGEDWFLMGEYD